MEGGEAVQLTTNGGTIASESRDGRFVYFAKGNPPRGDSSGIWRMPVGGGEEVQVIERVEMLLWQLVEQGIWYLNRRSVPPAVEFYDFATGQVRQSAVLEKRPTIWGFSVSPDERWFLYAQQETELDIMLVENFR